MGNDMATFDWLEEFYVTYKVTYNFAPRRCAQREEAL